jgi:RNA polymerase sigma factor (sigma-70 family)
VGRRKGDPMTFAGALLLTLNVAILFAIPLFGDNPYAETKSPEVRAMLGELVRIQREKYGPNLEEERTPLVSQVAAWSFAVGDSSLTRYLEEIRRFPMLEPQDEYMLAKRWREHGDRDAAHKLVTSHLRLVAKIAMGYRGYGLPISEVISEGNVGLMQAVKRFEPEKGFRLATYAMWWIKAAIQEYILRSWSLVKMGTTANQKKLFFNLRKAKSKISVLEEGDLRPDQVKLIAKRLGVSEQDVVDMNPRRRRVAQRADPRGRRFRRMAGLAGRRRQRPGNAAGGERRIRQPQEGAGRCGIGAQ